MYERLEARDPTAAKTLRYLNRAVHEHQSDLNAVALAKDVRRLVDQLERMMP